MAQRVGRGIALLFHNRDTRSSTPRPHFTPGKDTVPILHESGWAPGPVWTGGKSRPHRNSIPDRPARSQSLYRLSYRAHVHVGGPLLLSDFHKTSIFWPDFFKNPQMSNFMKFRPVGAELFQANGRTNGRRQTETVPKMQSLQSVCPHVHYMLQIH